MRGLGFLAGACSVHYHSDAGRRERAARAGCGARLAQAIGIDDYAGVLYEDGRIARVVSWRRGAAAHRVVLRERRIVEELLPGESVRLLCK